MEDYDVDDASREANPSDDEDESRDSDSDSDSDRNDFQVVDDASITEKWRERKRKWDDKKTTSSEIARLNRNEFCELLSIDPDYSTDNGGEENDEFVTKANELFEALTVTSQHSNHEGLQGETEELRSQIGNLRTEIRNLEQQLQDDSPRNLDPQASSDDSQRYRELNQQLILAKEQSIRDKEQLILAKEQSIRDKEQLIQSNEQLIQQSIQHNQQKMIDDFSLYIGKILDAHEKVALQLSIYRTKGNETYPKSGDRSSRQYSENLNRIDPKMEPSPTIADVALRNPQECGDIQDGIVSTLGAATVQAIQDFESFFHNLMSKATMADELEDTTMALSNTIKAIQEQEIQDEMIYLKPSETKDEETKVEQPIARAVLHKLLDLVGVDKAFITSEQYLSPVEGYLGARRVDFLAHSTREHLLNLSLHHMITASVEVKASLETKTDQKMAKGENQNVGHMSKRMLASFHLMGVGSNEVLYGITMSLKFVSAVRMELSGVGTLQPKVSCDRTERIAIGSSKNAFLVIAGALKLSIQSDTKPVVICSNLQSDERGKTLERFLGAGAFSSVYKIRERAFLKLPKSAKAGRNLTREAQILASLAQKEVPNVPTSPREVALKLCLRGQVGQCRGLELQGIIGESADSITFEKEELLQVMGSVSTALSCAHSCNIIHLDIRPSNIIVLRGMKGDNDVEVMVSDWGCAVSTTEDIFFHGCIPFAHDELLQKDRRKAKPKKMYDWASFIYTFFYLQERSLPWSNDITTRNCGQPAIEERKSAVERWWSKLPCETRDQFNDQKEKSGIGKEHSSKRPSPRRSPRNSNKKLKS